jgi:hypothetical protein
VLNEHNVSGDRISKPADYQQTEVHQINHCAAHNEILHSKKKATYHGHLDSFQPNRKNPSQKKLSGQCLACSEIAPILTKNLSPITRYFIEKVKCQPFANAGMLSPLWFNMVPFFGGALELMPRAKDRTPTRKTEQPMRTPQCGEMRPTHFGKMRRSARSRPGKRF